jgi:hypothetical protein
MDTMPPGASSEYGSDRAELGVEGRPLFADQKRKRTCRHRAAALAEPPRACPLTAATLKCRLDETMKLLSREFGLGLA